jgi:hypothetical protein
MRQLVLDYAIQHHLAEADTGLVDEHEQAASEGKLPMTW